MKVTALYLLLVIEFVDSDEPAVSVTVSPARLQFFKYENFSVSCEDEEGKEAAAGWRVMMKMKDEGVRSSHAPYSVSAAFPTTDSGVYWCETGLGATSSKVNITVTAGFVVLESPAHPVTEGVSLTLNCVCKAAASNCNLPADFYKDGLPIKRSLTGSITIHNVSRSDQGLYKCKVFGLRDSAESQLTVRAPPAGQDPPTPPLPISTLVCHLMVGVPYLLSTVLLGLIYRDKRREKRDRQSRQTSNDVIMQITA